MIRFFRCLWLFFSEERKGDILSRISGDVNEVENSVMSSLDMLFKNPILILIYLTTMTVLSWQLTLFVLLVLPIMGFIMGRVEEPLKEPLSRHKTNGEN